MGPRSKVALLVIAFVVVLAGGPYVYLTHFKDFAPRMESARHEVFKQNQAYVDGKITHLNRLKLEYQMAEDGHKRILRAAILTEASTVDNSKLPYDLQAFLNTL